MNKAKNIGVETKIPAEQCDDKNCPFHGTINVKGRTLKGLIVSKDLHKSATIQMESFQKIAKYERYLKKTSRVRVHNPPCINAEVGDTVRVMECRPLSKTKNFVVIEKLGHDAFAEQKIKDDAETESKRSGKQNKTDDSGAGKIEASKPKAKESSQDKKTQEAKEE